MKSIVLHKTGTDLLDYKPDPLSNVESIFKQSTDIHILIKYSLHEPFIGAWI